jgi:hypothetical protein
MAIVLEQMHISPRDILGQDSGIVLNSQNDIALTKCLLRHRSSHAAMGETHDIAFVGSPPICAQPKGKLLPVTMLK